MNIFLKKKSVIFEIPRLRLGMTSHYYSLWRGMLGHTN